MNYIDVFNGDADGICSLIQLRNAYPQPARLVTGVKRDIELLRHIEGKPGDHVTVLDISFDRNRHDVQRLLKQGASIEYFDHHFSGPLIDHPELKTMINDQSTSLCTGLIVDRHIGGRFRTWALVAAFGDNMNKTALSLGREAGLNQDTLNHLHHLGMYINYNSYGKNPSDLFFQPDSLYRHLQQYNSPVDFFREDKIIYKTLENGYREDMIKAGNSPFLFQSDDSAVVLFHNEKWARRVNGVYINDLANQFPDRAHAVITENTDNTCSVNIRAPLNRKTLPADQLARQFLSGGGRKGAAGINALQTDQLDRFVESFKTYFSR